MKSPFKALTDINKTKALQAHQILRFLCFLITSICLSKTAALTDIAQYELFIFYASLFSFFWVNGILSTFLTLEKTQQNIYKGFGLLLVANVLFTGIVLFVGNFLPSMFTLKPAFILLFIGYFFCNNLTFFTEYLFLYRNQGVTLLRYSCISAIIYFSGLFLIFYTSFSLSKLLTFLFIMSVGKVLFLLFVLLKSPVHYGINKSHITDSLFLSGSFIAGGGGEYTDGIIINRMLNPGMFAIYQYGAREFPLFQLMANAFSNSILPEFHGGDLNPILLKIKQESLRLMNYFFPIAIILMLSSKFLFVKIFSGTFSQSALVFNIYLLILIPRMVFPQSILIGLRYSRFTMYISIVELLLNISLSILLAQYFGIIGVAWGTVIASVSEKVIMLLFVRYQLKIKISDFIPINKFVLFSFLLLTVCVLQSFL